MRTPHPRLCPGCRARPVAHSKAKYCYNCRTRGSRTPPTCRKCGSTTLYYSAGLCQRCHKYAPALPDACPYCHAWGLFKTSSGVCDSCRDWRRRHPGEHACPGCGEIQSLNDTGLCRMCWRRERARARAPEHWTSAEAQVEGHQLFISDLEQKAALATPRDRRPRRRQKPIRTRPRARPQPRPFRLADHRQLVLFEADRDLTRLGQVPEPPLPELATALEAIAVEYAEVYGWAVDTISAVRRGLRLLLALQDTSGAPIKASEAIQLRQIALPVGPTLEVLRSAQVLEDDKIPTTVTWFETRIQTLPPTMAQELRLWFTIAREGSCQPPRRRPRSDRTIRNHFTYALPVLRRWAQTHESLREITRAEVQAALTEAGAQRISVLRGLRAIFRVLKAHKQVFTDPTSRIFSGMPEATIPVQQQAANLRDALESSHPARAALAGLLIFHGLRPRQLRQMLLTDLRDGRLHIDDQVILLAPQVSARLAANLSYRAERWPNTVNPHVFITVVTARKTTEAHRNWVNTTLGFRAQHLREDRILDEAHASDGDIRRICDLFGLTVGAAQRYIDALQHPDLRGPSASS
jgi:hypothetical protein